MSQNTIGTRVARGMLFVALALLAALLPARALATDTENQGIRVLPAPGKIAIDGEFGDWDLSGGVFSCPDVENLRDRIACWFHLNYDAENLYVLARFNDETPVSSTRDPRADFGWNDDAIQFRVVVDANGPKDRCTHFVAWRHVSGMETVEVVYDRNFTGGYKGKNALTNGEAKQTIKVWANKKGYNQEIALPWKLITRDGVAPKAGESLRITIQPWWGGIGPWGMTVTDIFNPAVKADRVFTFSNSNCWGVAPLMPQGKAKPQVVRLTDNRAFEVRMDGGQPAIDWMGLIRSKEPQGFKPITFKIPDDGFVSLNILDEHGKVVRQLLTEAFYTRGEHTVQWDGLGVSHPVSPGSPMPAGEYTARVLFHKGVGLRFDGWACGSPTAAPWDGAPGSGWGGDMGAPSGVATQGDTVLLGWSGSEAGKAAVCTDLAGNVKWRHKRGGFGGAWLTAIDGNTAFIADGNTIYKLAIDTGMAEVWTRNNHGDLPIASIFNDAPDAPDNLSGMSAAAGKLYITTPVRAIAMANIRDWKAALELLSKSGDPVTLAVWERLGKLENVGGAPGRGTVAKRITDWLGGKTHDLNGLSQHGWARDVRDQVTEVLNGLASDPAFTAAGGSVAPADRLLANRRLIEQSFGALLTVKASAPALCVIDSVSGTLLKTLPLPLPGQIHAVSESLIYVVSEGSRVLAVNPTTGEARPIVQGLTGATGVAATPDRIFVGTRAPDHQIRVFTLDGKPAGTMGRKGGRQLLGAWQPDGLHNIHSIAVAKDGSLWAAESDTFPSRFSRWSIAGEGAGKLAAEFFGGTHYGASGGAILPADPSVVVGMGCEWKIDAKTGFGRCVGVIDRQIHAFAKFCKGSNGKTYLAVKVPHLFMAGPNDGIRIFERLGPAQYKLRATVFTTGGGAKATSFWADVNGDEQVQPEEVSTLPSSLTLAGYYGWSLYLADDLTLSPGDPDNKRGLIINVSGFTACGAPIYDVKKAIPTRAYRGGLLSRDKKQLLTLAADGPPMPWGWILRCFDVKSNAELWNYPAAWSEVHGSHEAPGPDAGLIRGALGIIGSARLPDPIGNVWAINTNCGEWHLFNEKGFYVARIFQGDAVKQRLPDKAVPGAIMDNAPSGMGGEDFGGCIVQDDDGTLRLQSGKVAYWTLHAVGFDAAKAIKAGRVKIEPADIVKATAMRESLLQTKAAVKSVTAPRATPTLTGKLEADFPAGAIVAFKKQDEAAVKAALAWDETTLYLGFDVLDKTPWKNGATEPAYIYTGGDSVDFQLGADPTAAKDRNEAVQGDFRLSIGDLKGTPTAVLYRRVAKEKRPMEFNSGVVKRYVMESVTVLANATIKVTPRDNGYTVEAAIPLAALDFKPTAGTTYRGDLGVMHGDAAGSRTRLRTYWNNQQTGIVDDAVYELMMNPNAWGEIRF